MDDFREIGKTEAKLKKAAKQQQFDAPDDELTGILKKYDGEELSLDELDQVAAASSAPKVNFKDFMKKNLHKDG